MTSQFSATSNDGTNEPMTFKSAGDAFKNITTFGNQMEKIEEESDKSSRVESIFDSQ